MLKGLEIKNENRGTLFNASQTAGVDHEDNTKDNNSDSSEEESENENLEIKLNNSKNLTHNFSKKLE